MRELVPGSFTWSRLSQRHGDDFSGTLVMRADGKLAYAVIGNPPGRLSLPPGAAVDDPSSLRASVRGRLDLDFDALIAGDGVCIVGGGRERLRDLASRLPAG